MLLVRTIVAPSAIAGNGLFAGEDIPEGTLVWQESALNPVLSAQDVAQLTPVQREQLHHYAYRTAEGWHWCLDNAKFMNHADHPNLQEITTPDGLSANIAVRDIRAGEELTCDYRLFDLDAEAKLKRV